MNILCIITLLATVAAVDLNQEGVRKAQPRFDRVSHSCSVTKGLFATGEWAYRYQITKPWCGELPQWPSVNLVPTVTDWSPYDRLVLDIYNDSTGGDCLQMFISEKEGRIQNGLMSRRPLPIRDFGYVRWVFELKDWPKTCNPKKIGRVHFFMTAPNSANLTISTFALLKPGEALPEVSGEFLEKRVKAGEEKRIAIAREKRQRSLNRFIALCRESGQDGKPAWIGEASSMESIRPRDNFSARAASGFSLALARGEQEALQVLVLPEAENQRNVRVEVSALRQERGASGDGLASKPELPASSFKVSPVGYIEVVNPAPYRSGYCTPTNTPAGYVRETKTADLGWWPDPILSWLKSADIKKGDVQSFWVNCKCPRNQSAGFYKGEVRVSGEGWQKRFPLRVRVYDFEIPKSSPLPLAVTFDPAPSGQFATPDEIRLNREIAADRQSPVNVWKRHREEWIDFLGEHFLLVDSLYHRGGVDWQAIERAKAEGITGRFNLGYWNFPENLEEGTKAAWIGGMHRRFDANYRKAKELGLLKEAYIYGCDECPPKLFPQIAFALGELKKAYPDVEITTTSYDHNFGLGTALGKMDGFTPTTDMFESNLAKVAPSRAKGHRVWWYIACGQQAPRANFFVEGQPIEARQLMGAQAVKYRPDGFLYYQTTLWNCRRPISGTSTFTDWNPRSWTRFHGDGSLYCCGPDGIPCETIRSANFRDGIEDYAYAMAYERATGKKCEVSDKIAKSVWQFNDDAAAYYGWRNAIADETEKSQKGK